MRGRLHVGDALELALLLLARGIVERDLDDLRTLWTPASPGLAYSTRNTAAAAISACFRPFPITRPSERQFRLSVLDIRLRIDTGHRVLGTALERSEKSPKSREFPRIGSCSKPELGLARSGPLASLAGLDPRPFGAGKTIDEGGVQAMKPFDVLTAGMLTAAVALASDAVLAEPPRKPNIVVIMTDDVGWGDLGSYGGGAMRGAATPNLDRLAAEGTRFVNYYGQASCTAGRASFITGRIPIRTSLSAVLAPGDPNGLTKETPTIAQYLKQAGYRSVQFGKWHVGDRPENFPTANGFDEMYDMLPYYAGVYAYDDLELHPNFPKNDKDFMKIWSQVDLSPMGRQGRRSAHGDEEGIHLCRSRDRRRHDAGQCHRLVEGPRQG